MPPTRIMGVLNVTPDSFSDGGSYIDPLIAVEHARKMIAEGATIIDVGGESTRPGADRVTPEEEQRRVLPIIRSLATEGIFVSIDTVNASTARLAVEAGAKIINDVSGGTADPNMRRVAADTGAHFVIMHWRGIPDPTHVRSDYVDVVTDVYEELRSLAAAAIDAGVSPEKIILDPGLGFDKTTAQGWQLLAALPRLAGLGYPLLIGISRKRMLAETLRETKADGASGTSDHDREPKTGVSTGRRGIAAASHASTSDRDLATAVVSAFCAHHGAWAVRVHDVAATETALAVAAALSAGAVSGASSSSTSSTQVGSSCPVSARNGATSDQLATLRRESDRITLTGLEVFAHHGVYEFEREQGQRFLIDAEVAVDLRAAAAGDDLARTVHYGQLADAILVAASNEPVDLIETLAERIAGVALSFDGVTEARITVHKPDAPIDAQFEDVSVSIVRSDEEQS